MKLYAGQGACSMSCHIALQESRIPFEVVLDNWEEVAKLNPQGAVPVLVLDDGKVLTQNIAILTYIADRASDSGLLPKVGSFERSQTFQWLAWVSADLHPAFGPLFNDKISKEHREAQTQRVHELLQQAETYLQGKTFLVGSQFTVADAFLFTLYGWTKWLKISTDSYRNLNGYASRIAERPSVQAVLKREGLV